MDIKINMSVFGIAAIVLTQSTWVEYYLHKFATEPDDRFGGGVGKVVFANQLAQELKATDRFFNSHPRHRYNYPKRWAEFMEDCVILASLRSYIDKKPIALLDPIELIHSDYMSPQVA